MSDQNNFSRAFKSALSNRRTALTDLNATSSRSHSILTLKLAHTNSEAQKRIYGQIHLIDLAGNEDNRQSGNLGHSKRMAESSNINKSIFTLGLQLNLF